MHATMFVLHTHPGWLCGFVLSIVLLLFILYDVLAGGRSCICAAIEKLSRHACLRHARVVLKSY